MRRWLSFASALLIATAGVGAGLGSTAWAASSPPSSGATALHPKSTPHQLAGQESVTAGTKQLLRLAPAPAGSQLQAPVQPRVAQPLATTPTAKINVTYVGFSPAARTAFQAAVNIWETNVHSSVPIDVVADWSDLRSFGDGVLGAAGPSAFVENFPGAPQHNVYYPAALANAISGTDQIPASVCDSDPSNPDPSGAEISASFNSVPPAPWSFRTDGVVPTGTVDFESVVLHELGHGLGFIGSDDVPGNPSTGVGTSGLNADGQSPTVFDTFTADGSDRPLDTTYANDTTALGNALRGEDGGVTWDGTFGDAAGVLADGHAPYLFAPDPFQEGSSYSHLDEDTYLGGPNALMTPALPSGVAVHSPGPIMLGMFQDMGWPQSAVVPAIGDYHIATPMRLVNQQTVSSSAPLNVAVAGVDGVPSTGVKAVVVNIAVQKPTRTGVWQTLPGCSGGSFPASQNFQAAQTRTSQSVLPLDDSGRIRIALTASPAAVMTGIVSVDLVGWYGSGGVSYHQLASQVQVFGGSIHYTGADVAVAGVGTVPKTGVTAVVLYAGTGFETTPGFLFVGPGGVNSGVPTVGYQVGDFTANLAVVPLGTGSGAGKVRIHLTTPSSAAVVLDVIGWYGPSTAGGTAFHSAGPARQPGAPVGQDVTIGGLPESTPVLLDIHLVGPTANATLSVAPGGSSALATTQEFKAKQNASGRTVVMTNANGQVRLHLSAGTARFYTDFEGWFSP